MNPWQPWQQQQQASHYPPGPPQQAAFGAFFGPPSAQVTTGFSFSQYHVPAARQQVVCGICGKPIRWGEPQCHFPPWNANDGVGSGGGDGNGTDGTLLPAITLHVLCGKGARALGRPNLHLVSPVTITCRYGKSLPTYRNPSGAVKAAIQRSRRCLLEFNGFETPILYHLEGEIVPLVEEELAKWRTGTNGKKEGAADEGGRVAAASAASVSEEQRKREEEEREIDDEARAVLEAIVAEKEEVIVTEKERAARGDDCDVSGQAIDGKRVGGRGDKARRPYSPPSRKRKQHHSGEEQSELHLSKKAKQQGGQSKSLAAGTAVGLVRKRQKTSFLCDEQAKEWAKPKIQSKANGMKRLQDKISTTYNKYVCTKNALYREKRRNEELQARLETRMRAFPRSQQESLIAYANAAIDSDRGGEVRRAIERFREDEIRFMKGSREDVIDVICDHGVVEENEMKFIGKHKAVKRGDTHRDETKTKKYTNRNDKESNEETNRSEKEAKEDTNCSEKEVTEDRKAEEDMNRNETEAKEGADVTTTVTDEPR